MPPPTDPTSASSRLWRLSGMGSELAFGVIGMGLLGFLLDRWMHTKPWIMVACIMLGLIGGGWNFIRRALAESRATAEQFKRDHPFGVTPPTKPAGRRKRARGGSAGGGSAGGGSAGGGIAGGASGNASGGDQPPPPTPGRSRSVPDGEDPYAGT